MILLCLIQGSIPCPSVELRLGQIVGILLLPLKADQVVSYLDIESVLGWPARDFILPM